MLFAVMHHHYLHVVTVTTTSAFHENYKKNVTCIEILPSLLVKSSDMDEGLCLSPHPFPALPRDITL